MDARVLQEYLDRASTFQHQAFGLLDVAEQRSSDSHDDLLQQIVMLLTVSHASLSAARSMLKSEIEREDDQFPA